MAIEAGSSSVGRLDGVLDLINARRNSPKISADRIYPSGPRVSFMAVMVAAKALSGGLVGC